MRHNHRYDRVVQLKKQIRLERRIFLLVILLLAVLAYYHSRAHLLCAIKVEGKTIVWAKSKPDAEKIINMVKQRQVGVLPPGVKTAFSQKYELSAEKFTGEEIPAHEEAVEKLLPHLTLLVKAHIISVDRKPVVAVASEEQAEQVLNQITQKFRPPSGQPLEKYFKEPVEVKPGSVPAALFKSNVFDAVDVLTGEGSAGVSHLVKAGESLTSIANRCDVSLARLEELNPGVTEVENLVAGTRVLVKEPKPLVTVVWVMQDWEHPPGGEGETSSRRVKVTYENRVLVHREAFD